MEIRRYLNSISKTVKTRDLLTQKEDKVVYAFYGDGQGDLEKREPSASVEVVNDYIVYCEEQIRIAKGYLSGK